MRLNSTLKRLSLKNLTAYSKDLSKMYRIWLSRLFSGSSYREINKDLKIYPALLHYVRYSDNYGRQNGQTPLSKWLLPLLMERKITSAQARKLAKHSNRYDFEILASRLHLNIFDYNFLIDWENLRFEAAKQNIRQMSPTWCLRAAYLLADKRNNMEEAQFALNSVYPIREELNYTDLRRAMDLAIGIGLGKYTSEFGKLLAKKASIGTLDAQIFESRMPFIRTKTSRPVDPKLKNIGLRPIDCTTPRQVQLENLPDIYKTLLTLSTYNSFGGTPFVYIPRTQQTALLSSLAGAEKAELVCVRILAPSYWVSPQCDHHVTGGALRVQNNFIAACIRDGIPILPVFATPLFNITDEQRFELPTFSYHTLTRDHSSEKLNDTIHFKEGYLPDHFLLDHRGYSGWSSLASEHISTWPHVNPENASEYRESLKDIYVISRWTKYVQSQSAVPKLDKPYIFAALQVPDDTVAALAYMPRFEWLDTLLNYAAKTKNFVVIKPHPKDTSKATQDLLLHCERRGAIVTDSDVHKLIRGSACVVTVNSGVGFEALLHPRPVITLGKCDYAAATLQSENTEQLENALDSVFSGRRRTEDDIAQVLYVLTKSRSVNLQDLEDP